MISLFLLSSVVERSAVIELVVLLSSVVERVTVNHNIGSSNLPAGVILNYEPKRTSALYLLGNRRTSH